MKTTQNYKKLQRWSVPECYFGPSYTEYFVVPFILTRDSDALGRANFEAARGALEDFAGFERTVATHWACGWVDGILMHESDLAGLEAANALAERYDVYPCLDESLWSEFEENDAQEVWANCYTWQQRIAYIREFENQFEFSSLTEMLDVVRGRYFNGYASELLA